MDFPILLGKRIKELRKQTGLSQDQVAEKAGISGKYLGQVERGEVNVSAVILYKLASVFDVTIEEIYDFEHQNSTSSLKTRLIDFINNTSEQNLRTLYRVIRSIFK